MDRQYEWQQRGDVRYVLDGHRGEGRLSRVVLAGVGFLTVVGSYVLFDTSGLLKATGLDTAEASISRLAHLSGSADEVTGGGAGDQAKAGATTANDATIQAGPGVTNAFAASATNETRGGQIADNSDDIGGSLNSGGNGSDAAGGAGSGSGGSGNGSDSEGDGGNGVGGGADADLDIDAGLASLNLRANVSGAADFSRGSTGAGVAASAPLSDDNLPNIDVNADVELGTDGDSIDVDLVIDVDGHGGSDGSLLDILGPGLGSGLLH